MRHDAASFPGGPLGPAARHDELVTKDLPGDRGVGGPVSSGAMRGIHHRDTFGGPTREPEIVGERGADRDRDIGRRPM